MQPHVQDNKTGTDTSLSYERYTSLWDHAISIFQTDYEWLSAMDLFEYLAEQAPVPLVKAMLLLNIGIIKCHLADHSNVQPIFQKTLPLAKYTSPLAHFLLGLARFEREEYEPARISFRLCSVVLHATSLEYDYRPFGLDFVLDADKVLENEETAAYEWAMENKKWDGCKPQHRLPHRLPGSLLFTSAIMSSLVEAKPIASPSPEMSRARRNSCASHYSVEEPSKTPERIHRTPSETDAPLRKSPRPLPKRLMVPRDACAESPNLRLMAHFLNNTGPESSPAAVEKEVNKALSGGIHKPHNQHGFWDFMINAPDQRESIPSYVLLRPTDIRIVGTISTSTNKNRLPEESRKLLRKLSIRTLGRKRKATAALPTMAEESEDTDSLTITSKKASTSLPSRQLSSPNPRNEPERIGSRDWYTNPRSRPEKKKTANDQTPQKESIKKDTNKVTRKSMDSFMIFGLGSWL